MKLYVLTLEEYNGPTTILVGVYSELEQALKVGEENRGEAFYPLISCTELNKKMENE